MPREADWRRFVEKRMTPLDALAFLPRGNDGASGCVVHHHAAAVESTESVRPNLAAVDQRQSQSVGDDRPELLHQIKGKTGASRPIAMKVLAAR